MLFNQFAMLQKTFTIILTAILLFPHFSSHSEEVIGLELQYRLRKDNTAHYNKMWEKLVDMGLSRDISVLPLKRAFRDYSADGNSCLFPTSMQSLKASFPQFANADLIETKSVDYVTLTILTLPDQPKITETAQLDGKRIAMWNGLDPKLFFADVNVHVETTNDDATQLKMLNNKRVDAVVGFIPDIFLAADSIQSPYPKYEGNLRFFDRNQVSMVCFNKPENKAFITEFNQLITQLKDSGELQKILGPHAVVSK